MSRLDVFVEEAFIIVLVKETSELLYAGPKDNNDAFNGFLQRYLAAAKAIRPRPTQP